MPATHSKVLSRKTSQGRHQRLLKARLRRLLLQYLLPWSGAVVVGLVAVWYARWSTDAYQMFIRAIAGRPWVAFVITPVLTVLAVFLTRKWFGGSEGSGIPQVIAALQAPQDRALISRLFGLRVIVGKIVVSLLGLLGGLTIGREGPTVHLGAAIMNELQRFYPHHTPQLERQLLLAGAAAGLSAAFNTPLAGIIFAIEELARDFNSNLNSTVIITVVFSGLTSLALAGDYLYFGQLNVPQSFHLAFVQPVMVAAILSGLLGAAFNWTLLNWTAWMPKILQTWRMNSPLRYALVIGLMIATLGTLTSNATWGSGYDQARQLLDGTHALSQTYPLTKWASLVISYMAGIPGGLFSPSLSIGAGLAQWVHALFIWAPLPALIALCMTGYLSAVTQSPITSFVIVLEMTNGSNMVIPMMASALVASRISALFTPPLYHALAHKNYASKLDCPKV